MKSISRSLQLVELNIDLLEVLPERGFAICLFVWVFFIVLKPLEIFMFLNYGSLKPFKINRNFFRVGSNVTPSNTGKPGSCMGLLTFIALNLNLMKTLVQSNT